MRRIAIINQKGGVGKTTTSANLGAALALQGRRVALVDMDAQANLSLSLDREVPSEAPSTYSVLLGSSSFAQALRPTKVPGLSICPANIDLSGAELELASAIGREYLLRDALRAWEESAQKETGRAPADYVLFDCPPSLGLLSINALAAAREVLITIQTEFLALQGMSKLVEVVQLLRKRLNPELVITGIVPCLYDSRLKLAREVLGEIRRYFPGQVFPDPVRANVKLAEAPSYGQTIFEYAPGSNGAKDYLWVAREILRQEARDPALAGLPPFTEKLPALAPPSASAAAPVVSAPKPVVTTPKPAAAIAAPKPVPAAKEPAATKPTPAKPAAPKPPTTPAVQQVAAKPVKAKPVAAKIVAPAPAPAKTVSPAPAPAKPASPKAPAAAKPEAPKPAAPARAPRAVLRAEDLPHLPPDAFEILNSGSDAS